MLGFYTIDIISDTQTKSHSIPKPKSDLTLKQKNNSTHQFLSYDINIIKKQKRKKESYIKSVMKQNTVIEIQGHQKLNRLVLSENCLCDIQDINLVHASGNLNQGDFGGEEMGNAGAGERGCNAETVTTCWTQEETQCLFDLFQKLGSKWTKISQLMPGKTQNCIKNRFYGSLRKVLRRMNKAAKNLVKKFKKELKFESITRIIDAAEGLFRLKSPLKEESEYLSKKIIGLAKLEEYEMNPQEAQELIKQINKFNMLTRSYKSQKKIAHHRSANKDKKAQESLSRSLKLESIRELTLDRLKAEQQSMQHYLNASSTHQQNFLSSQQNPNIIKEEPKELCVIRSIGQEQLLDKRTKSLEEFILEELEMEVYSPLQCQAWL